MNLEDLMIDAEFASKMANDSHEPWQLEAMEEDFRLHGFGNDPIEHWHGLIVDGHTRYAIWQKMVAEDPDCNCPQVAEIGLPDRESVLRYIERKQINRRNVTDKRLMYYRGIMSKRTATASTDGQPEGQVHNNGKPKPKKKNRKGLSAIAKKVGVHRSTLHKSEQFVEAVDSLDKRGVAKKADLLDGSVPMRTVLKAAKATTKSEAQQVLEVAKAPPQDARMELGKRFAAPMRMLQKLDEEFPYPRFKAIKAEIDKWFEAAADTL